MAQQRGAWGSRLGFVLAAAGSAVGLGNIWKFPYITGQNGGGAFVLIYLAFVFGIGLPIMIGEIMIGRMAQTSQVGAYKKLGQGQLGWMGIGLLGIFTGYVVLSFYSVVAGWSLHYIWLSISGGLSAKSPAEITAGFEAVRGDGSLNVFLHLLFMLATILIVISGVKKGVERAAKVMMPTLLAVLLVLFAYSTTLSGFPKAFDFILGFHSEKLTMAGVVEALGHSFFTLSVGMGAMLTYGSYLKEDSDIVGTSIVITVLDTLIAMLACLILFPITFTEGLPPAIGPGLVFNNMPIAFNGLPGGSAWTTVFFVLLFFAALTTSISLLEVCATYFIDQLGWSRAKGTLVAGSAIILLGIPSALSRGDGMFGTGMKEAIGHTWFEVFADVIPNYSLAIGGLGIAAFSAWRIGGRARELAYTNGDKLSLLGRTYLAWLGVMRFVVPVAILVILAKHMGLV